MLCMRGKRAGGAHRTLLAHGANTIKRKWWRLAPDGFAEYVENHIFLVLGENSHVVHQEKMGVWHPSPTAGT